jgi:hypothetical protein
MGRNESHEPSNEPRVAKIARVVGGTAVALICFGFSREVQEGWLCVVLVSISSLIVLWAVWQAVRKID